MSAVGERIGHIVIRDRIGEGGMGEVFLGFDEVLERPVAVKRLKAERRFDEQTKARLLREARILSRLDHPGICRIWDLVETPDADYLVLEHIEGVTLDQLTREDVSRQTLLGVLADVTSALAAAHEIGIVHRDLKPANIMVTPDGEPKILDFGIARSLPHGGDPRPEPSGDNPTQGFPPARSSAARVGNGEEDRTVQWDTAIALQRLTELTARGAIVGTARYMSPEQASGKPVTAASDMYSLGIMLQELLCDEPAYHAKGPELLLRVVEADTVPARCGDDQLEDLIEGLKAKRPSHRPSASEAAEILRQIVDRPIRRRRLRRQLLLVGATFLLAAASALLIGRTWWAPPPLLAPDERVRLAVLPVVQEDGADTASLGQLSVLVNDRLALSERLGVVPTEKLAETLAGLDIDPDSDGWEEEDLRRLREALGCRMAIGSRIDASSGGYRLSARVHDLRGHAEKVTVTGEDPTEMAVRLGDLLRVRLIGPDLAERTPPPFSHSSLATTLYAVGIDRLLTLGPESARSYFAACLDLDPGFVQARFQLAVCAHRLGSLEEATSHAEAVLKSTDASDDTRLGAQAVQLLGIVALGAGDLDSAAAHWHDSLRMFRRLDNADGAARALNGLGVAAFHRGDLEAAISRYDDALAAARECGNRLVEGEILINRGRLALQLRRPHEATPDLERAVEIFRRIGYRQREAVALQNLAAVDWQEGALDRARDRLSATIEIAREIGDRSIEGQASSMQGLVAWSAGELDEAEARFRSAIAIQRGIGDALEESRALGNLCGVHSDAGRLETALTCLERSIEMKQTVGAEFDIAIDRITLAGLLLRLGRPAEASATLELARSRAGGIPEFVDMEARLAFSDARPGDAVRLAEEARRLAGDAWTVEQQQRLESYRRAAGTG